MMRRVLRVLSLAEPPLTSGKVAKRSQEIDLTQVGSEGLHEIELTVRALPEHEVGKPLLTRSSDNQIGIRLTARVQVLADELGRQDLGERVEFATLALVLAHNAAHRIRNLA